MWAELAGEGWREGFECISELIKTCISRAFLYLCWKVDVCVCMFVCLAGAASPLDLVGRG